MAPDLRDRPTRDACDDGMLILLVGKPMGPTDFVEEGSEVEARATMRGKDPNRC